LRNLIRVARAPVGEKGQIVCLLRYHLVDQGTGGSVESSPQFPPGFVQGRLEDEELVRSSLVFVLGPDTGPVGCFPTHPGHIQMLEDSDLFGDPR
jgi:hypothetical protein